MNYDINKFADWLNATHNYHMTIADAKYADTLLNGTEYEVAAKTRQAHKEDLVRFVKEYKLFYGPG